MIEFRTFWRSWHRLGDEVVRHGRCPSVGGLGVQAPSHGPYAVCAGKRKPGSVDLLQKVVALPITTGEVCGTDTPF